MKRIINGVTYNTDTSTRIGSSEWEDDGDHMAVLYQSRGGAFFLVVETSDFVWNERAQERQERVKTSFEPMSQEDAHEWMMEGEVEVFHNPFEDPPDATAEAEPGATIYIRVPASLKQRVDDAASVAKVSGNVWSMRCIEKCLSKTTIRDLPPLAYIWVIAATARACPDAEWSKKKCMTALAKIADFTDDLAAQLGVSLDDDPDSDFGGDSDYVALQKEFKPYS